MASTIVLCFIAESAGGECNASLRQGHHQGAVSHGLQPCTAAEPDRRLGHVRPGSAAPAVGTRRPAPSRRTDRRPLGVLPMGMFHAAIGAFGKKPADARSSDVIPAKPL